MSDASDNNGSPGAAAESRPPLERLLGVFAEVRAGEGVNALLLACTVFLLLMAYYIIKVVREPLILTSGDDGAAIKSYASAGQAVVSVFVVQGFDALARRMGRMALITSVNVFFAINLVIFFGLAQLAVPLGVAFYLWVGVFNNMVVATFWAFANDVYSVQQGERLFPLVGIGSSVGAVAGAAAAKPLGTLLGIYPMMLVSAGLLVGCLMLTAIVHRRERLSSHPAGGSERGGADQGGDGDGPPPAKPRDGPIGKSGAFALVLRDHYLLLVALLMLTLNWVNTSGEFILDRMLLERAREVAGAMQPADTAAFVEEFIWKFKSGFYFWVNLSGVVLQLFVVSRVIKFFGVRAALFVAPVIAGLGYTALAIAPLLVVIYVSKIAENSVDYSLQNTVRQTLFLVTSREAKYKAKATIDTVFVRLGDVCAAGLVWGGTRLSLSTDHYVYGVLGLVGIWLVVVAFIGHDYRRRAATPAVPAVA